ncbi:hypothetical protein PN492_07175 [Dolichospermum circinale CS-537/01]|uniref:NHL repeat-containing protein n=1 Tax=Dolichospermum circinale CS-537/01 TaxID=3021739 RepID=A0ABT5A4C0_9CYAN|nr:hypothetical protein [Dolichospermum circinale]MDB9486328.1 hypothetical protein [Dolichospermum circinale CS-537/01]
MNNKLFQSSKIRHKINQYINTLFRIRYWQKKIIFNIFLSVTCGLIVTFIGMKMDLGNTANTKIQLKNKASKSSEITYTTSWLGNTIGHGKLRVQNNIEGMYVKDDGTIYTNSYWDEAGSEAGIYKDGKPILNLEDTHGWNRLGGKAITVDNKYIYIAMSQGGMDQTKEDYPPKDQIWYCVRRYDFKGKPAPFAKGNGWDKSMLITSKSNQVTGLATVDNKLFVSNAGENTVLVYNTETMEELNRFTVTNPGDIAVDKKGSLWIIENQNSGTSGKIVNYSQIGKKLPQEIIDIDKPSALALDNRGRLLIAENGINQQLLIYNINNQPVRVDSFGDKKGIFSGVTGEVKMSKLYGITGVGTDSKGNFYINNNGFNKSGTDLRKFSPSGQIQWQLLGLIFVDNADTDPQTDGVNLFTKQEQYVMDYSKPSGQQWTYKAYIVNPFKYSQDPRLHTSPDGTFVRRIQGKPFLFLTDMFGAFLQIYRFQPNTDGKIAIPAGMFVGTNNGGKSITGNWPPYQPEKGEWIWRDINGNGAFEKNEYDSSEDYPYMGGWWVDSKGDVWKTLRTQDGIRRYPLQGIDNKGNPIYSYSSMQKIKTPTIFNDLRRIEYFPETDTMYLSGFTIEHPAFGDDTGVVGSEIVRFDNWSRGNPTPKWRTVVPYDTTGQRKVSTAAMSIAGDYVFAVTVKTAEVYVYKAATGELVQKMSPGPEVGNKSGWVDIPYGIRAFRRANGQYLVFVEENWQGKVLVYQLNL